jgi:hypothetical protein
LKKVDFLKQTFSKERAERESEAERWSYHSIKEDGDEAGKQRQ